MTVPIPQDFVTHLRRLEKRIAQLERRPVAASPEDLLGPGLTAQAVRIMDWDSRDATINGFFYSGVGGINVPDDTLTWTGQVIAKDDGSGMQQVWNTDGPETLNYTRTYSPDPGDPSLVIFTEWKRFLTATGYIGEQEIDPGVMDQINNPPTPALTDGDPPDVPPVVVGLGGIGSLFFRWTESPNADPVTYRLHVRADADPTTDGTYEVAAGVGLISSAVRRLKDGTALVPDGTVIYHAIVTAEDADNAILSVDPVESAAITVVPAQVTGPDIAVGAVTTDTLVFNDGWGINLTGETVTGVTVQTRSTPLRGIKTGIVDGIEGQYMYREDGTLFFKAVPTQGIAMLDGEAKLKSLTISPAVTEDGTSLGGVTEVTRHSDGSAGVFRLTGYTTPPKSAPTVTTDYDKVQFTDDDQWSYRHGWSTDGTYWYTARVAPGSGGVFAEKWSAVTGQLVTSTYAASSQGIFGSVVQGGNFYILYLSTYDGAYWVDRFNASTFAWTGSANWTAGSGIYAPTIGSDPATGDILIAQARSNNLSKVRIRRHTWPALDGDPLVNGAFIDTDSFPYDLAGVAYGTFDLGTNRYVYTARSGDSLFRVTDTTGGAVATETWEAPARRVGFAYSGGAFSTVDYTGTMRTFTGQDKTTAIGAANLTKWVSNDLYRPTRTVTVTTTTGGSATTVTAAVGTFLSTDVGATIVASPNIPAGATITGFTSSSQVTISAGAGVAGSITATLGTPLATTQSPRYKIVIPKRSKMTVTTSAINTGGTNAPDRVRIYVGQGATDPGRAAMWKQTDPAVGAITASYAALVTSGTSPVSTNGFQAAAGTIQRFEFADGTLFIDAVGNGSIPAGTFRDAVDARALAQVVSDAGISGTPVKVSTVSAASPFAGSVDFYRIGKFAYVTGVITRASSFATAFTATGITIPASCVPLAGMSMPTSPFFTAPTVVWQARVTAGGSLDIRMSAANATNMDVAMLYRVVA